MAVRQEESGWRPPCVTCCGKSLSKPQLAGGTACPTTADQAVAAKWDRRFRLSGHFFRSLLVACRGDLAATVPPSREPGDFSRFPFTGPWNAFKRDFRNFRYRGSAEA